MRIVIALGGNALLRRGQKPDADVRQENVGRAVDALAPLADEHELVLTHGNGPRSGVLALQSASNPQFTTPYPFDVLGAPRHDRLLAAPGDAEPARRPCRRHRLAPTRPRTFARWLVTLSVIVAPSSYSGQWYTGRPHQPTGPRCRSCGARWWVANAAVSYAGHDLAPTP